MLVWILELKVSEEFAAKKHHSLVFQGINKRQHPSIGKTNIFPEEIRLEHQANMRKGLPAENINGKIEIDFKK